MKIGAKNVSIERSLCVESKPIKFVPRKKIMKANTTSYRIILWKDVIMYSIKALSTCTRKEVQIMNRNRFRILNLCASSTYAYGCQAERTKIGPLGRPTFCQFFPSTNLLTFKTVETSKVMVIIIHLETDLTHYSWS